MSTGGILYSAARREGYNVLALAQHADDLAESFIMSGQPPPLWCHLACLIMRPAFHNGRLRTMKAHYLNGAGDVRIIRPFVHVRERQTREFAEHNGLPVITIRPRAIFGPGDTTIFPRVLDALRRGRLRIIGRGDNIQDLTYIDNVVDALLLCWQAPATTLGKKYNITNGEPVLIWAKLAELCAQLGYAFPKRRLPFRLAFGLAGLAETTYTLLRLQREPPVTRYAVSLLAKNMTLDISAARRDLGYAPRVTVDEGLDHFVQWWKATHL